MRRTASSRSFWPSRCWTSRRCARPSEKTSEARLAESVRDLGDQREELLAAAGVRSDRTRPEDLSLCLTAIRRRDDPGSIEDAGGPASAVRLSTSAHPLAAGGHRTEPQEAVPPLSGGAADGASTRRSQAGARDTGADDCAARTEPALEPRLRRRSAHRWS